MIANDIVDDKVFAKDKAHDDAYAVEIEVDDDYGGAGSEEQQVGLK